MKNMLKCFISSPLWVDTSNIRKILSEQSVEFFGVYDLQSGNSLSKNLVSEIRKADFAVIIIGEKYPNVYYEMGICEGLRKPMLIIIEEGITAPDFIHDHLHITSNLRETQFLKMTLSRFVEEFRSNRGKLLRRSIRTRPAHLSQDRIRSYIELASEFRQQEHVNENKLENLIYGVFEDLGLQIVSKESSFVGGKVDFALWSDQLETQIGNPILVEIKAGFLSHRTIVSSQEQLSSLINRTGAKAGILFYLDSEGKRFSDIYALEPLIISYDVEDFFEELLNKRFDEVILSSRNQIVPGDS